MIKTYWNRRREEREKRKEEEKMKMVKITLTDGSIKEMTRDEFITIPQENMMKEFDGKAVVNMEFYEEDGR